MSSKPESGPASGLSYPELQRWFLDGVVGPHRAAAQAPPPGVPALAVEAVILPSHSLDPAARLAIYSNMYMLRLLEVLEGVYPAVARVMGRAAFEAMAKDYLGRHPSRSYTLNDLGHALPHYLATHWPATPEPATPGLAAHGPAPQRALLTDVARLEYATSAAFDVDEGRVCTPAEIAAIPQEQWPEVRFRMHPSVHLLAFEHDAVGVVNAVAEDAPLPELTPGPRFAAVWRKDFTVWRKPLHEVAYRLLANLARGLTLGDAMDLAAERWDGPDEVLETRVFQWFSEWLDEGFFAAVTQPPQPNRPAPSGD
ncbi:DNA-binding domain-containing protein [Haliangium sp.]|uniref:HvfC/BufC N-terminal domain-containing protein n=1 Tax=Haliangium sp. TaxID=2663208 RepID=UPI003D1405B8